MRPLTYVTLGGLAAFVATLLIDFQPAGILAAVVALAFIALGIGGYCKERKEARYDLDELKRVHEGYQSDSGFDEPELTDESLVMCPRCGNVYEPDMLICPHCKSSTYSGWLGQ